jgi:hypothetical protein
VRGDATLAFTFTKAFTNGAVVFLFPLAATAAFSTAAFSTALALVAFTPAISTVSLLTLALLTLSTPVILAALPLSLPWCAVVASIGNPFLVAAEILLLVVAVAAKSASKFHLYFVSDPLAAQSDLWLLDLQKVYNPICGQLIFRTF